MASNLTEGHASSERERERALSLKSLKREKPKKLRAGDGFMPHGAE